MKSVNTVTLLGHVTNDPEVKTTAGGQTVCKFGLATNRVWKDSSGARQESVEFHNLVAWGKLADFCANTVKKGKPLFVEGHLKTGSWLNPDGVKLQRTEVIVDNTVLLSPKDKSPEIEQTTAVEEGVAVA